ncbi:MAG: cytochrome c [Phycisphaerales bacterium]
MKFNIPLPPKIFIYFAIVATTVALVPPAVIWWMREHNSDKTRIHIFQDMDNQSRFKTQQVNELFGDGRADRRPVEGSVARGLLQTDEHYWRGWADGDWATTFPSQFTIDRAFLERGQERYDIYCSVCHGAVGFGDGMVHQRVMQLVENPAISNGTTWVAPRSVHEPEVREQPVGQLYNTVTNGIRNMAGYASQIPAEDRWAIVAYMRALQRSQNAPDSDVPGVDRDSLRMDDLRTPTEEAAPAAASATGEPATATPSTPTSGAAS